MLQLIDLLGGADRVAELTGRKGSVSMDSENQASYKLRTGEVRDINRGGPMAALSARPPLHAYNPMFWEVAWDIYTCVQRCVSSTQGKKS